MILPFIESYRINLQLDMPKINLVSIIYKTF